MHRENLGSFWKIGRYPIKVSEVLSTPAYLVAWDYEQIWYPSYLGQWTLPDCEQKISDVISIEKIPVDFILKHTI